MARMVDHLIKDVCSRTNVVHLSCEQVQELLSELCDIQLELSKQSLRIAQLLSKLVPINDG